MRYLGQPFQGEGPSAGWPCMFLRTAYCQLSCSFCDTPYTWNWIGTSFSHPEKYDKDREIHPMTVEEVLYKLELSSIRVLVISGGEPMLQQRQMIPLATRLQDAGWWIEIETNGAVMPQPNFINQIDQINCSPKLSNSGDSLNRRIKPKALQALAENEKTSFKFVVGSKNDVDEVMELVNRFRMKDVWLMPQARTREELERMYPQVVVWGKQHGFHVSSRKQIEKWGTKRGV